MKQNFPRVSRKKAGEEVVSVLVQQALLAGATIEQLEQETGCKGDELRRLLEQLEKIDKMTREAN